ncbi:MAG: sugar phosphate nucleotidyltransferase, partial [Pseudomonadota bacterium]
NGSTGCIVAAMEVPPEKTSSYGILKIAEDMGSLVAASGMVEKPQPSDAPSNLAVIGRYILTPQVMESLNAMKIGAGGEIQLTDAIADQAANGRQVYGFRFRGQRFDCGSKSGYLQATVAFALQREELAEEFMDFLHAITRSPVAAE